MGNKRHKSPLKLILLTRLDRNLDNAIWKLRVLGKIGFKNWNMIFNLIDEIDDLALTRGYIERIIERSNIIMDIEERAYVLAESILILSNEIDVVRPLYDDINYVLDLIRSLNAPGFKLYLLAKLLYSSIKLEYDDLVLEIENIIGDLLASVDSKELADFYSYMAYLYFHLDDLSESESFIDYAIAHVDKIDSKVDRLKTMAKLVYRLSKINHNKDIERTINKLLVEIQGLINFEDEELVKAFVEISDYLYVVDPDFVYDKLDEIYDFFSTIRDPLERGLKLVKLLSTLNRIGNKELSESVLQQLIGIVTSKHLSDVDKFLLASEIAKASVNNNEELARYISYTILDGLLLLIKEDKVSREMLDPLAKIVNNISEVIPLEIEQKLNVLGKVLLSRIKLDPRRVVLFIEFLNKLKASIPKIAKNYLRYVIANLIHIVLKNSIYEMAEVIDKIYEVDESCGDEVLELILREIESTRSVFRKMMLLSTVIPRIPSEKSYRAEILRDYLHELLENKKPTTKFNVFLKLAEGYSVRDKELAKRYYHLALMQVEKLLSQDFLKGRKMLRKTLLSVKNKLKDEIWYEQLDQYYNTLELYLRIL